jgi:hypothetical protein
MVGIIDAANSTTNNNNKEYLIFGDITPQWFKRLNKISKKKENDNDDETLFRLYSEINDYKRCIIGETYGYDESYVIQGTKRYCQECIALSGNFSYALRQYKCHKLEEVIERFTKHWNEKHSEVLLYKHILLGEANIPIPAPTKTSGSIDPSKDVVALILVSIKKPAADMSKPTGINIRNLYLSYNHPLIGAKVAKARETGIKYIPAFSGLNFIEGP